MSSLQRDNVSTRSPQAVSYVVKVHPGSKAATPVIQSSSVRISIKQPAAQPLKVPPPVKAKPAKVHHPSSVEIKTPTDEFPPPPTFEQEMPQPQKSSVEDELDALTNMLALGLQSTDDPDFFGVCHKCRKTIIGEGQGCTAMGDMYHVSCFVCDECRTKLTGLEFFCLNDTPYCEKCYTNSLEDCSICKKKITERILKAVGASYHPHCFVCTGCERNLDGIPFTVDAANVVHCVECYQLKFSPRCASCDKLIMPSNERGETVHIVSMQKNFHVECYKCEDCGALLSSEEGRGCYPLDGHLLCQRCNGVRVQANTKKQQRSSQSTEL